MLLKKCNYYNCNKLVDYNVKYCELHKDTDKERYKEYKANRTDHKEQRCYGSKEWKIAREKAICFSFGLDLIELYLNNRIVKGETVHHIIEIKEDWNKRLDINNLFYLTQENHLKVHAKMNESKRNKEYIINMLMQLKERFKNEYIN